MRNCAVGQQQRLVWMRGASEPRCDDTKEVGGVGRGRGTRYRSLLPVARTPMRFLYRLWNRAEPCGWAATAPGLDARASEPRCPPYY